MWGVALIFIAVASCNAELYEVITADLPKMPFESRIIGGSPTTIKKYPFVVQVYIKKQFTCGGSLVTKQHVLTAAHCFARKRRPKKRDIVIVAGIATLYSNGSLHLVKEIIVHELYNLTYKRNDVAVVVMATPVDYKTSAARTIRIARQDDLIPDASFVTAVGWGRTNTTIASVSHVLNEVTVRKISLKTCRARYMKLQAATGKFFAITNSTICAGILDSGEKDVCIGDSGGPLLYRGILVGIISWGMGCSHPKYPAVYSRVAKFTNWIVDTVKKTRRMKITDSHQSTEPDKSGSLSSKIGAITLLTPLLYLILSV